MIRRVAVPTSTWTQSLAMAVPHWRPRSTMAVGLVAAAVLALGGCDSGPADPGDAGPADPTDGGALSPDGSIADGGTAPTDAGTSPGVDAGPPNPGDDDGNTGFETAVELTLGTPVAASNASATDLDFFRIDANAGDWIGFTVASTGDRGPWASPLTVTLLDNGRLALLSGAFRETECIPGEDGPEVLFHVPENGTYFVEVGTLDDFRGEEEGDFPYEVTAIDLSTVPGISIEDERGDTPADATTPSSGSVCILGAFGTGDTADHFEISASGVYGLTQLAQSDLASTAGPEALELVTADGSVHSRAPDNGGLLAIVDDTPAMLRLSAPASGGSNPYYVLRFIEVGSDLVTLESADATNGVLGGAESATAGTCAFDSMTGSESLVGFITSIEAGDVDYFVLDVNPGRFEVRCSASALGSGVRGLVVELRDDTDAVLQTGTESLGEAAVSETLTSAAQRYIRLSATEAPDPDLASRLVTCQAVTCSMTEPEPAPRPDM